MAWKGYAAACLALAPSTAAASEQDNWIFTSKTTGSILMEICGSDWSAGNYDPCGAYITGLVDGIGIAGNQICPPSDPNIVNQMATMVYRTVRDKPERWHFPVSWTAKAVLQENFPCKSG